MNAPPLVYTGPARDLTAAVSDAELARNAATLADSVARRALANLRNLRNLAATVGTRPALRERIAATRRLALAALQCRASLRRLAAAHHELRAAVARWDTL